MNSGSVEKQKVLVLGTGSLAPAVADLLDETGKYEVEGFVENWNPENCKKRLERRPILWIDEISNFVLTHKVICALGSTHRRNFVEHAYKLGFSFITLIHPSAHISGKSSLGEGTILSTGSIIAAHANIGRHVLVNRGCLIGHHTTISDYSTISPGANIAATVNIGEGTYVGIGAIILDHITIGAGCIIGAGAVVTRDVPDHVQVMGMPAKVTKEGIEGL